MVDHMSPLRRSYVGNATQREVAYVGENSGVARGAGGHAPNPGK